MNSRRIALDEMCDHTQAHDSVAWTRIAWLTRDFPRKES